MPSKIVSLLLLVPATLGGAASAACGGSDATIADEQLVAEAVLPGAPVATVDGGEAGAPERSDPRGAAPDGGAAPTKEPTPVVADAGAAPPPPAPAPAPAPVPVADANGCVNESEPNNTSATADPLPGSVVAFCGVISGAGDQDFASFVMPATAERLRVRFQRSGEVEGTITVDGATFRAGEDTAPAVPGGRYSIRVFSRSTNSSANAYRLELEPR